MAGYHVIVLHDDNTVYDVSEPLTKELAQELGLFWVDSAFVVCIVSDDCMAYSDNAVIKRARDFEKKRASLKTAMCANWKRKKE